MNDTLKIIEERYSCRDFLSDMPSDEMLHDVANAAVQSPSGVNRQAWRVIVVKNKQLMDDMETEGLRILSAMEDKTTYNRIVLRGGTLFYHAPCMIVVPIDPGANGKDLTAAALDCGILCENTAIAASSLGLGNLICGLAGLAFAGDKALEFKQRLGFPEGFEFGASILLGYAKTAAIPHTPDQTKISFIE